MQFTDTHTHLYTEQFEADREQAVKQAIEAGITRMVLPAIDSQYIKAQKDLAKAFPENIAMGAGLHPSSVRQNYKEELEIVKAEIESGKYIAVGEIGIDLYWDKTYKAEQTEAFDFQIKLAKKHKLPIIIHVRNAFDEVFEVVRQNNDEQLNGVFHSFTGSANQAKTIQEFGGFKIGINGIVTFKNSDLGDIVKTIPAEYIVLETDSPYLAPHPKRGKRNESKYLIYIAEKIAELYGISLEKLSSITEQNAAELYNNYLN
ncbi:MAG: TatD family hydrolase [Bacteroidota bacterium]|nr:TatD family hydrolase [Bacteroidota bacterium]